MDSFPVEITAAILSNLPVESILRCRSVCKTWCTIIDTPRFAELHLNTSTTAQSGNKTSLIFLPNYFDDIYIANEDHKVPSILKTKTIEISCKRKSCKYAEHPVNGLLFMYSSKFHHVSIAIDSYSMYIANPGTRDCVKLPNFNSLQCKRAALIRGFGFDEISKEFKVVQIASCSADWCHSTDSEVQVYTLGSNSWRNLGKAPDANFITLGSAFVNGSSHWLIQSKPKVRGESWYSLEILSFNMGSEEFVIVPIPESEFLSNSKSASGLLNFQLAVLGGLLTVVASCFENHIEIWVLKEYHVKESWTKYSISKSFIDGLQFKDVRPISFRKHCEIVLLYGSSKLVSYNVKSGEFMPLEIVGLPGCSLQYGISPDFYQVYSYVESLFPVSQLQNTGTLS